jgi:hypothetical protein
MPGLKSKFRTSLQNREKLHSFMVNSFIEVSLKAIEQKVTIFLKSMIIDDNQ